MKPRIPFRIGYQYSNWELNLDATIPDRIPENKMCVSYQWIGRNKPFLNFIPDSTELLFHWDRLSVVMLTFEHKDDAFYSALNDVLTVKFGLPIVFSTEQEVRYKYTWKNDIECWCICLYSNSLMVVYGKREILSLFLPVCKSP